MVKSGASWQELFIAWCLRRDLFHKIQELSTGRGRHVGYDDSILTRMSHEFQKCGEQGVVRVPYGRALE